MEILSLEKHSKPHNSLNWKFAQVIIIRAKLIRIEDFWREDVCVYLFTEDLQRNSRRISLQLPIYDLQDRIVGHGGDNGRSALTQLLSLPPMILIETRPELLLFAEFYRYVKND